LGAQLRAQSRPVERVASPNGSSFLAQGQVVGPEIATDAPILNVVGTPAGAVATASDGTNHFVVWTNSGQVWGGRMRASDGAMLDPTAIPICTVLGSKGPPSVAFDGANYLVAFADDRNGENFDVYGVLVAPDGTLVGGASPESSGFPIGTGPLHQLTPRVAFGGGSYLVVWQDFRSDAAGDVYGARVTPAGVAGAVLPISTAPARQAAPSVAFDGARFLVLWDDQRASNTSDIYAAFVTSNGTLVGDPSTGGIPISTALDIQQTPVAAFDGTNYLIAWSDRRTGSFDIRAAQLTPAGGLVNATAATSGVPIPSAGGDQTTPAIAFDGSRSLIAWTAGTAGTPKIYSALVTTGGAVAGNDTFVGNGSAPAVAFGGGKYVVAWTGAQAVRVSPDNVVVDSAGPANLAADVTANSQTNPVIAFDGQNYLLLWFDSRLSGQTLAIRIRAQDGAVLDPTPIQLPIPAAEVAVIFDGSNYLIAWFEFTKAFAIRMTPNGTVLESPTLLFDAALFNATQGGGINVGFDGSQFLVVMRTHESGPRYSLIAVSLNRDGTLVGGNLSSAVHYLTSGRPDGSLCGATPSHQTCISQPGLAFDGTSYMLAWEAAQRVQAIQLRTDGSTIGTIATNSIVVSENTGRPATLPALAYDGSTFLVTWEDYRSNLSSNSFSESQLFGQRLSTSGGLIGSNFAMTSGPRTFHFQPAVIFDDDAFLVAWRDNRSGNFDLYGGRMTSGAPLLDATEFPISTGPGDELAPRLVAGPRMQALVAYTRPVAALKASRVFARLIGEVATDGGLVGDARVEASRDGAAIESGLDDATNTTDTSTDRSPPEAAPSDANDATLPDAAEESDGNRPDSATSDAASVTDGRAASDAASVTDGRAASDAASVTDGRAAGDATDEVGSSGASDTGCSCKSAGRTSGTTPLARLFSAALLAGFVWRRRRTQTERTGSKITTTWPKAVAPGQSRN
jgi:hypothetical protein